MPNGSRTTNTYAADALRRKTQDSTGTKLFVYDGSSLLLEKDGSGATQARYTGDPGAYGPWWQVRGTGATAQVQFVGSDVPGNVRVLMLPQRVFSDEYAYSAFGVLLSSSGTSINRFRFGGEAGYQNDGLGTSLLKVGFRWYDELTGTWISVDPIGFEGGDWNLRRYVENSPTNTVDPSGRGHGTAWGLFSGQLKFDGCDPRFINAYFCVVPESSISPNINPGGAIADGRETQNIDGIAFGMGAIMKVPDNCTLTIKCRLNQIVDLSCDCISIPWTKSATSRCEWKNPYTSDDGYWKPLRRQCNKPFPPISDCLSSFLGRVLPTERTPQPPPTMPRY